MIYTKDGTPLGEALTLARMRAPTPRIPLYRIDLNSNDTFQRAYRTERDRLGDPYRIYRLDTREHRGRYDGKALRAIRAHYGVGRPVATTPVRFAA